MHLFIRLTPYRVPRTMLECVLRAGVQPTDCTTFQGPIPPVFLKDQRAYGREEHIEIVRLFSCRLQPHQFPLRWKLWEFVGERSQRCFVSTDSFILNICRKQSHSSLPNYEDPYLSSFVITFSTRYWRLLLGYGVYFLDLFFL